MIDANQTIRGARITDRQALSELSLRVHASEGGHRRSLGVPAPTLQTPPIRLSALIPAWLPLRAPSVHLVAEVGGRIVGSCRAIEEPHRDDWVITELDAEDGPLASEIRYAMLAALVEAGADRNVSRFHAACADVRENLELFGQSGFMAYAQEEIWWRRPGPPPGARSWLRTLLRSSKRGGGASRADSPATGAPKLQPAGAPDAWHAFDLWTHATPPAIARIEAYGAPDWESVGQEAIVPRSSLNPLLHFTEVKAWLMPVDQRVGGLAQHGATRSGPHYLRFLVRDGADGAGFLNAVLGRMGGDAIAAGILSPVRTYESAGTRAAEAAGFEPIGRVTLLVREVRARVRQPVLVPATH
ncbi:MAG: hypothetical protein ACXWWQ_06400 [Candidatus Limnocylindria bacterium]